MPRRVPGGWLRPLGVVALLTVGTALLGFYLSAHLVVGATTRHRGAPKATRTHEQPLASSPQARELRRLQLIEEASTSGWNQTRTVLLLGLKARRDFHVYDWPFREHGFKVSWRETPLELVDRGDSSARRGWLDGPWHPRAGPPSAGVVACHSIFTHNCLRVPSPSVPKPNEELSGDHSLVYALLLPRQKINRISFARKVLTTKDGFCGAPPIASGVLTAGA